MSDHGHSHNPLGHDAHGAGHGGVGKYIAVFVALCLLTMCSFATYSELWRTHLPPAVGWAFMMTVSCTKAALVILFFMHLKYEADWKYILTIPASIMSIFLVLALIPDVGLRVRRYSEERLEHVGTQADADALEKASEAAAHEESHGAGHAQPAHGH